MGAAGRRIVEALATFQDVFRNPDLRRLQLAWAAYVVGSWSYVVALVVYAFEQDGAYAVGLLGVLRWTTAAIAAPFAGIVGDRFPRVRVMVGAYIVRTASLAAMGAVVLFDGPSVAVYALSAVAAVGATVFGPSEAALTPSLARTPEELTAANVTSSTIESAGTFVGPALGGLLLAGTSPELVFAATALFHVCSITLISGVREPARKPPSKDAEERGRLREHVAGVTTIVGDPTLRLLVLLLAAQTLVDGALDVLIIILALDVLQTGSAGVGFLNSAAGVGGLVAAVIAAVLVRRGRLATDVGAGIVLWGTPLLLIGLWPNEVAALVLFAVVGVGGTLVAVSSDTLLQRAVPGDVLARVFGMLDSVLLVAIALGALGAPALVDAFGARAAFVVVGAVLPLLALLTWRRLRAIDDVAQQPLRELELLEAVPFLAPLPRPTLEHLASRLVRRNVLAGEAVIRQGEPGDRFYVVAEGELAVTVDDESATPLRARDSFGEIALLRDTPRTATVTAVTDGVLYALEREDFVGAVAGHSESIRAAGAVIGARLAGRRAGPAPP